MNRDSVEFSQRWRVARACARCHRLKMKCVFEDPSHSTCQRCFSLGIKCSLDVDPTAETAKRRKVSRSPSQVASKIDKLLSSVAKEWESVKPDEIDEEHLVQLQAKIEQIKQAAQGTLRVPDGAYKSTHHPDEPLHFADGEATHDRLDAIDHLVHERKLLTTDQAIKRFEFFLSEMLVFYPIIPFPQSLRNFFQMKFESPLLLTTCIFVTTVDHHGLSEKHHNASLNKALKEYVYGVLASKVYGEGSDFTYHTVLCFLILSLWCVPPARMGEFRSQIDLVTSYCLSLCLDAGNVTVYSREQLDLDNSAERNNLRSFLALFCCCGSLSFSLPRFRVVSWNSRHEIAVNRLSQPHGKMAPTQSDQFLCSFAKLVSVGQQLFDHFQDIGLMMKLLTSDETHGVLESPKFRNLAKIPLSECVSVLELYKASLKDIIHDSGYFEGILVPKEDAPLEKYTLLLTFHHLMMSTHDNLVSWCLYKLTMGTKDNAPKKEFSEAENEIIVTHTKNLGNSCREVLKIFIKMTEGKSTKYPTFIYYRAIVALISLTRMQIMVKSEILSKRFTDLHALNFDLPELYSKVTSIVNNNSQQFDSEICRRFSPILAKIMRWVNVANTFKFNNSKRQDVIEFIKLTDLNKGQEVEKLAAPTDDKAAKSPNNVPNEKDLRPGHPHGDYSASLSHPTMRNFSVDSDVGVQSNIHYSLQEIFKEFDEDIIKYLNPYDSSDAAVPTTLTNGYFSNEFI